jgi:DNA-binding NarL/FixJ family response regulator
MCTREGEVIVKRVYVLWEHPLFFDSVRLLLRNPGVELVGATSDHEIFQAQARSLKPDVVIIEKTGEEEIDSMEAMTVLRGGSKVICLSLDDNELNVYRHQHRTATNVEDLLGLILGNFNNE